MIDWKTLNSKPQSKYCKGSIVAARIYADVPGNKCSCGGAYSKRVPHPDDKDIIVPRCFQCDQYPPVFLIDADARSINGGKLRVKIRHDQNSQRLDKISKVIFTLERIQMEITEDIFDIRKYDSEASRLSFIFENYYYNEYLVKYEGDQEYQEWLKTLPPGTDLGSVKPVGIPPTKKMSPKGLREKKGFIERELLPKFGEMDITKITAVTIKKFRDSYTSKFRTRDLALGELKAILNEAKRDTKLILVPDFDPIPRAKVRTNVIDIDLARYTIQFIHKEIYRDMYTILTTEPYIIRPCEIRSLKWKNIDFIKDEFTIDSHFSDEIELSGRKSIDEGEASTLTFPMTPEVREIFLKYLPPVPGIVPIDLKERYVFIGRFGNHISGETLRDAWVNARKKAGHDHDAYECKHATATAISAKVNGNIMKLKKIGGWTNTATLERYVHEKTDLKELF